MGRYQVRMKRPARFESAKKLAATGAALGGALLGASSADAVPIYSNPEDQTLAPGQGKITINLSNLLPGLPNPPFEADAEIRYQQDPTTNNLNLNFVTLNNMAAGIANPLQGGAEIGGSRNFLTEFNLGTQNPLDPPFGPWVGATNAFLGLTVNSGQNLHFGWVRLSVDEKLGIVFQDLAIESEPGTSIAAGAGAVPEPGSLGLLALGAAGLAVWRKRRDG
jgi:hypothetical protein